MSNLREEFEKLRLVAEMLQHGGDLINFDSLDSMYCSKSNDTQCIADWLNAAWYAFQEQQKKIDAVLEFIDSDELGHDARLGDFYRDIEELLK